MNLFPTINEQDLNHLQGGTFLGYTAGWLTHALFEHSKSEAAAQRLADAGPIM